MDLIRKLIIDIITIAIFLQLSIINEAVVTANTTLTPNNTLLSQPFDKEFLRENDFDADISKEGSPKKIKSNDELLQTQNQIENVGDNEPVTITNTEKEDKTFNSNSTTNKPNELDNHNLHITGSVDDLGKFTYAKFHNSNHVYELANDPNYKKYGDTDYDFQTSTHKMPLYGHSSENTNNFDLARYRYGQTLENDTIENAKAKSPETESRQTTIENSIDETKVKNLDNKTKNANSIINNASDEKLFKEVTEEHKGRSTEKENLYSHDTNEDKLEMSTETQTSTDRQLNESKNEIKGINKPEKIKVILTSTPRNIEHGDQIKSSQEHYSTGDPVTDTVLSISTFSVTEKTANETEQVHTPKTGNHNLISNDNSVNMKLLDNKEISDHIGKNSEVKTDVTPTATSIKSNTESQFKSKSFKNVDVTTSDPGITDNVFNYSVIIPIQTNTNEEAGKSTDLPTETTVTLKEISTTQVYENVTDQESYLENKTDETTPDEGTSTSMLTTTTRNDNTSPLDLTPTTTFYTSPLLSTTDSLIVETVTPSTVPTETTTDSNDYSSTVSEITTISDHLTDEDTSTVISITTGMGENTSATESAATSTITSEITTLSQYTQYSDVTSTIKQTPEDTTTVSAPTTQDFSYTDNTTGSTRMAKSSNISQSTNQEDTSTSLPTSTLQAEIYRTESVSTDESDSTLTTESVATTIRENGTTGQSVDNAEVNKSTVIAIAVSSVSCVCLVLLATLFFIMKRRRKRFSYLQRCTPVGLDEYSVDNASVYNSLRKGNQRKSKSSYGNPAFDDSSCISNPLGFPKLVKFSENADDINTEFEAIPQITAKSSELPDGCDSKNRYANVIPLPETRVHLALVDNQPNSDYVNANYVRGVKNKCKFYIATQAPLENTVDDFWRMIWEQQSKLVLMLTHLYENGVEKCVDYLPPSEVLDCHRLFGDFQVTLKKRDVKDKYIVSSLQLKNMVTDSKRDLTHIWYLGWPEKGVPEEANSIIAFLIEARSYVKSSGTTKEIFLNGNAIGNNSDDEDHISPIVVHCSPGTGRTGTVIACDIAIRDFESTVTVDIPKIVYRIRRDRANSVLTKEQYAFIYKVVSLYAAKLNGNSLDSL